MQFAAGVILGQFEILGAIGAGGMGEVYRARDARLGREVAIKVLPAAFRGDAARLARFEREARVLAALDHPSIARIHGLERTEEATFLALEYVPGEALSTRIGGRAMKLPEVTTMLLSLAERLELAHECGVIHRDLKPSNLRITPAGELKILDFGLAKPMLAAGSDTTDLRGLAGDVEVSREGDIVGTPAYMSPEQARGRSVDRRTDIWSFGCVAFECLTGKRAFSGDSVFDVLMAVVEDEPEWEALPKTLPPALRFLLERCLIKDPQKRLRDIGEARLVLEDLARGADGLAPWEKSAKRAPRVSRGALVAALALGALAGGVGRSAWLSQPEPRATRKHRFQPEGAAWGTSLQPAISPEGERLAYVCGERLYVRELARLDARELPGTEKASHPFWSPKGEWIGFAAGRGLWKVRPNGGVPSAVAGLPEEVLANGGFVWRGDDTIVFATAESGLLAVPAGGGDIVEMLAIDPRTEKDFHQPALLPRDALVFPAHYVKRLHRSLDILRDGKRSTLLAVDGQYPERPLYSSSGHLLYERNGAHQGIWGVRFSAERLQLEGEPFLIAQDGSRPSLASDGTLVYEHSGRSATRQLAWLDRGGQRSSQALPEDIEGLVWPVLSEDGRQVALIDMEQGPIWIADLERRTCSRVTSAKDRFHPYRWLASGAIVCVANPVAGDSYRVMEVHSDGMDSARLLVDESNERIGQTTTPIVYSTWSDTTNYDLWVLPAGDAPARPLIATDDRDESPVVSRDGSLLAWASTKNKRSEIYLTTFPEAGPILQVSVSGGRDPRWSAGSLFFVTEANELMEVPVEASPTLQLGEVRRVLAGSAVGVDFLADRYDVSADGQRILVLQDPSRGAARPSIVVVEDWLSEFKER